MSYFEKIGNSISSKSKEIASKAKAFSETNSLNNMVKAEQNKIDANFRIIGKLYYEKFGNSPDEDFAEAVEAVNNSRCEIDKINEQIKKIKSRNCCANCGAPFKNDAVFCSKCGERVKQEVEEKPEIKCLNCGNVLEDDAVFCDSCGTKVGGDAPAAVKEIELPVIETDASEEKKESVVAENAVVLEEKSIAEDAVVTESEEDKAIKGICPSCGEKSEDDMANFCNNCGTRLK